MSNTKNNVKSTNPRDENFCWFEFLNQPKSDFSKEDLKDACALSNNWITCGCGQLCNSLPRHENSNAPIDPILVHLGLDFMENILNAYDAYVDHEEGFLSRIESAKSVLIKIEERTIALLALQDVMNNLVD
jgi:hypothetical protein